MDCKSFYKGCQLQKLWIAKVLIATMHKKIFNYKGFGLQKFLIATMHTKVVNYKNCGLQKFFVAAMRKKDPQ